MRTLLLGSLLLLAAGAAQADNELFYLGAGISSNKVTDIASINSDLSRTSWKAFAGVRPLSGFAVEADYLDLGTRTINVDSFSNTHVGYKAYAGYAVGFVPLPLPVVDVFAKLGFARWSESGGSTLGSGFGSSFTSLSANGTELAWGIGAQAHYGMFGGRLEYEAFHVTNTSGAGVLSLSFMLRL